LKVADFGSLRRLWLEHKGNGCDGFDGFDGSNDGKEEKNKTKKNQFA
jgi:hypothetical protein